jgi:hypothetical protein
LHFRRNFETAEDGFLVGLIGDAEAGLQSDVLAEFAQQLGAEGVDRSALDPLNTGPQFAHEAFRDLTRCLVGESEDTDSLGLDAELVDQESDSPDQAERLARARTRQDQKRSGRSFDGKKLRRRGAARNRSGAGAYRRRLSERRWVSARGLVRARGRDRQDVL